MSESPVIAEVDAVHTFFGLSYARLRWQFTRVGGMAYNLLFDRFEFVRRASHRRAYFRWQDTSYHLALELEVTATPERRAVILTAMAECEAQLADRHPWTFGPDPLPDEPGRDLAESLRFSSQVLLDLAEVDRTVALRTAGWNGQVGCRRPGVPGSPVEETCGSILDLMVDEGGTLKTGQFDLLYERARPIIGGQAAETIASVQGLLPKVDTELGFALDGGLEREGT
jgi:hypothetical protein